VSFYDPYGLNPYYAGVVAFGAGYGVSNGVRAIFEFSSEAAFQLKQAEYKSSMTEFCFHGITAACGAADTRFLPQSMQRDHIDFSRRIPSGCPKAMIVNRPQPVK
jgi:hypothetical protein